MESDWPELAPASGLDSEVEHIDPPRTVTMEQLERGTQPSIHSLVAADLSVDENSDEPPILPVNGVNAFPRSEPYPGVPQDEPEPLEHYSTARQLPRTSRHKTPLLSFRRKHNTLYHHIDPPLRKSKRNASPILTIHPPIFRNLRSSPLPLASSMLTNASLVC